MRSAYTHLLSVPRHNLGYPSVLVLCQMLIDLKVVIALCLATTRSFAIASEFPMTVR